MYCNMESKEIILGNKFFIVLITIFLFMDKADAAPPPLPPALPQLESDKMNQQKEEAGSLLEKIQQFMHSKKIDNELSGSSKPSSTPQDTNNEEGEIDSFIDLGNNKLPTLENTKELDQLDKHLYQKIDLDTPSKNDSNTNKDSPTLPTTEVKDAVPIKPLDSSAQSKPQIDIPSSNKSEPQATVPSVTIPDKEKDPVILQQSSNADNKEVVAPNLDILPSSQEKKPASPQVTAPIVPIVSPKENTESKVTKPQTLIPVFVKKDKQLDDSSKTALEKDTIERDRNVIKEVQEVNKYQPHQSAITKDKASTIKETSPKITEFVQDETQMLLLPNDDVVLGELTEEARLEQMDMYSFIQMFKKIYDSDNRKQQRKMIDNFINNYDSDFHTTIVSDATDRAFEAVRKNNLFVLRVLLDNYPIIQRRGNDNYTLLHEAAETNNYYIAKLLIMRGINIKATNYHCRTALDISDEQNNNVGCLIMKATAN
ncbi:ankyrin repeat domain-containing protein [Candidatus Tisiphia endosymbiont of Melanophora roralis]|uniref:ankyrin repeat domain-containing protein n=1 Tax=Candidatus Tisiphia endosymbiont of Melanophora roralis TaxID=3066261 RepID=UPI001E71AED4|nr:MAG: ankyrin repeat domain-containing protein [Rickettsia endosymbiont of Cimex lectularius]